MTDKSMNKIQTWQQGRFIDQHHYSRMSAAEKRNHAAILKALGVEG
ncbi:hypothetical protein Q4525_19440 [Shimia thalassica]|nr:hypothetical protein [Shimia thalassica]MBU2943816.1 hypothetical protein [Shimia thalassica]MDO6485805.1 hypothetical protein [Shimia thalassica]MDO6505117.1 hypothetical protein [Shimia thalassica]